MKMLYHHLTQALVLAGVGMCGRPVPVPVSPCCQSSGGGRPTHTWSMVTTSPQSEMIRDTSDVIGSLLSAT